MDDGILPRVAEPSRADVEACWLSLISGDVTRSAVHEWATRWVEGTEPANDPMVQNGLQYLHGFDLIRSPDRSGAVRHSATGDYIRSDTEVIHELERWHSRCLEYDRDPEAYAQTARIRALNALLREADGNASTDAD
jgi:hypothetical protein